MDGTAQEDPSDTRLYGSAIAVVSGLYAIYQSTTAMAMTGPSWFMLVLGIVVFVHGALLLTPVAERIGAASGPLMILWAALMLADQAWLAWMGGMGRPGMMEPAMTWDVGMIAIALLMLVSGAIMTRTDGERAGM